MCLFVKVYDPVRTAQGSLALRAFRLTAKFMDMYKDGDFSYTKVNREALTYDKIFEEVPVIVKSSSLARMLLSELEGEAKLEGVRHILLAVPRPPSPRRRAPLFLLSVGQTKCSAWCVAFGVRRVRLWSPSLPVPGPDRAPLPWSDPVSVSTSVVGPRFCPRQEFDRLDLSTNSYLEKNLRQLMGAVEDLTQEKQKYHMYQKDTARRSQQQQQFLHKRKQEKDQAIKAGEEVRLTPTHPPTHPHRTTHLACFCGAHCPAARVQHVGVRCPTTFCANRSVDSRAPHGLTRRDSLARSH